MGKGELEDGAGIDTGGKEFRGTPAEANVYGEVELAVEAVVEGIGHAREETVAVEVGILPVGVEAVECFGLNVEGAVDGDAVGEADVGVAEDSEGFAVVDVGVDGVEQVVGGGEVVGFEVEGGGLLFAGFDNHVFDVFGLAESRRAECQQDGEDEDLSGVFHCCVACCPRDCLL